MARKNSFWSRFWNIFRAKSHKALDKIEDPIEALEMKTRDLKETYRTAVEGLAKVKAVEIKYTKKAEDLRKQAEEHMNTAKKLRTGLKKGGFEGRTEAETKKDIAFMLQKHKKTIEQAEHAEDMAKKQNVIVVNLENKIKKTKNLIEETETNTANLKAQNEASKINREVSKELSGANFDGVESQIEEIEGRIRENNAEAEAWESLDESFMDEEERIEQMLNESPESTDDDLLSEFLNEDEEEEKEEQ